jgi:hypothetical protein
VPDDPPLPAASAAAVSSPFNTQDRISIAAPAALTSPFRLRVMPPAGVAYRQCSFRSPSFRGPPPLTGAFHGSQTWAAPTCRARGILSWASSEGSRKTDSRAQACFAISGTPGASCSPSSRARLRGGWSVQRLTETAALGRNRGLPKAAARYREARWPAPLADRVSRRRPVRWRVTLGFRISPSRGKRI